MSADAAPRESSADERGRVHRVRMLARRALRLEATMYASIARAIARRPWRAAGEETFGYHAQSLVLLAVFVVLSAVELVVIDLIVHPWPWVRIPLLVVGIWGLIWMAGFLCAHLMRPHAVGPQGVRVRDALDLDVQVAWDDVASVALRARTHEHKSARVVEDGETRALVVAVADQTNIEVVLERPTLVLLPGGGPSGGPQLLDRLSFWVDEPASHLDAVRRHIDAGGRETQAP